MTFGSLFNCGESPLYLPPPCVPSPSLTPVAASAFQSGKLADIPMKPQLVYVALQSYRPLLSREVRIHGVGNNKQVVTRTS